MAHVVVMPKLGNTVESCIIVKWKVSAGEPVKADTVLCEIETDKATMDVPAGVEGVLLGRLREEGEDVPVLEPIALVGAAGEKVEPGLRAAHSDHPAPAAPATPEAPATAVTQATPVAAAAAPAAPAPSAVRPDLPAPADASLRGFSPRARVLARAEGFPLDAIPGGTGPKGRVIERDVRAALARAPGMTAAARQGDARGIALLHDPRSSGPTGGSGLGGRLTAADLKAAAPAFPGPYTDTPIKSIRKIIADRMMRSLKDSAQLTLNSSAPAGRLLALRGRFKDSDPVLGFSGVTIGDMVAFAAARVLVRYPRLNSHVIDGVIRGWTQVHLGLAVDCPRGLMVPVLRNAQSLDLRQFSAQSKLLAKSCVEGSPDPDLLSGSTFTVTNLGAFGIESFTPILNAPETAILGVDAIMPRPLMDAEGKPGVEMRIGFSLTVDHRVVDGAEAARFLKDLADYIANIDIVLLAATGEGSNA